MMFFFEGTCAMRSRAFTLIELLIVVAIIAILAAIAVPNLLEAQVRAKISRVKADLKTIVTANEAYRLDYNTYNIPYYRSQGALKLVDGAGHLFYRQGSFIDGNGFPLTSPVSYITSFPIDPFPPPYYQEHHYTAVSYHYQAWPLTRFSNPEFTNPAIPSERWRFKNVPYLLRSAGPDRVLWAAQPEAMYDPTNGTVSPGEIWYFAPYGLYGGGQK
jgi:prepilin-type N-terminal cleavage/methylation domain-containing protein